jgi:hypothetical protein
MTALGTSTSTLLPHAGPRGGRPYVVLDDTICAPGEDYPRDLRALLDAALRITSPDRVVLTAQEAKSPWWTPITADAGVRVLTLPVERGLGIHLAVGALEVCRRAPMARAVFVTGPLRGATVDAIIRGSSFAAAPHRMPGPASQPAAVLGTAASFAAHVAAVNPDGFELLLFAVACSTDQERPELLDSTFLYLEHLADERWLPDIPPASPIPAVASPNATTSTRDPALPR